MATRSIFICIFFILSTKIGLANNPDNFENKNPNVETCKIFGFGVEEKKSGEILCLEEGNSVILDEKIESKHWLDEIKSLLREVFPKGSFEMQLCTGRNTAEFECKSWDGTSSRLN